VSIYSAISEEVDVIITRGPPHGFFSTVYQAPTITLATERCSQPCKGCGESVTLRAMRPWLTALGAPEDGLGGTPGAATCRRK
jgi:hypothetical protein